MADNFLYAQLQSYALYGAGASIGDTSITLKSMLDIDGNALSMSGTFGTIGFGTIEPGNGSSEEQISFTGLTNNSNGTVTLTGVKSVGFTAPYTATSGLAKTHPGSTTFVISNTAGFYDHLTSKNDDETIAGIYTFTNPNVPRLDTAHTYAGGEEEYFATKRYVDGVAIAGAPDAATTTKGVTKLSYAPISSTNPIAVADTDPRVPTQAENDALVGTSGTPSSTNKFVTNADTSTTAIAGAVVRATSGSVIDHSYVQVTDIQSFTTSGTTSWTKPTSAKWVEVTVIGAGGAGGSGATGGHNGGGAGGGYGFKRFAASALGSTETVVVGAGGTNAVNNTNGDDGGYSAFGTSVLLKALGGTGGSNTGSATGGTSNGDISYTGGAGGASDGGAGVDATTQVSPRGGGSGGYNGGTPAIAAAGGNGGGFTTYYVKAGGAGGAAGVNAGTAGTSTTAGLIYGGVGGGGGGYNGTGTNTGGNGGAGGFPGGGGGGSSGTNNNGGSGADGMVYVVTYF